MKPVGPTTVPMFLCVRFNCGGGSTVVKPASKKVYTSTHILHGQCSVLNVKYPEAG
jgi:hypothetical protein